MITQEKEFTGFRISGFLAIFIGLLLTAFCIFLIAIKIDPFKVVSLVIITIIQTMVSKGRIIIEPNEAQVLTLFGKYKGTFTGNGFFWINPFYKKRKIYLRARNLDITPVKVNDKVGNPIMIGAVLVWKIKDTYKATFQIDTANHDILNIAAKFIRTQSDTALRQVAGMYAYDSYETEEITLRSDGDEVSQKLEEELNNRLAIAGIEVIEARINYLAYAPEIASVMLRRQQADAIIASREKIVESAVSMVHLALKKLSENKIVEFDNEHRAIMVSNLLAVLCADDTSQPIINAE